MPYRVFETRWFGRLLMLVVAVAVFAIAICFTRVWIAALLAIVVFALWFLLNLHSGTTGLIRANLFVYFNARRAGQSHEDSLARMVYSRFRFFATNGEHKAELVLASIPPDLDAKEEVEQSVFEIFCIELGGEPPFELETRIRRTILKEYLRYASRYGIEND